MPTHDGDRPIGNLGVPLMSCEPIEPFGELARDRFATEDVRIDSMTRSVLDLANQLSECRGDRLRITRRNDPVRYPASFQHPFDIAATFGDRENRPTCAKVFVEFRGNAHGSITCIEQQEDIGSHHGAHALGVGHLASVRDTMIKPSTLDFLCEVEM